MACSRVNFNRIRVYVTYGSAAVLCHVGPADHMNGETDVLTGEYTVLVCDTGFLFPVHFLCSSLRYSAPLNLRLYYNANWRPG